MTGPVVVIGSNGQLGVDIVAYLQHQVDVEVIPLSHSDIDISHLDDLFRILKEISPKVVISTAAWHSPVTDENVGRFFQTNATGSYNLAVVCREITADLVWFSTDYVFDGQTKQPYTEQSVANPISVYGVSKYSGEMIIRNIWHKHFVIRIAGVYGIQGCRAKGGTNVVETFIKLAQGNTSTTFNADQYASSTYTVDVAERLPTLIDSQRYGLYHMVNTGEFSWYEFAQKIFSVLGIKPEIIPGKMDDQKSEYPRPRYSVLENAELKRAGIVDMPTVQDALGRYIEARNTRKTI